MSHESPAATVLPQVFAWENAVAFVPPMVMLLIVSGELPVFVSLAVCGGGMQQSRFFILTLMKFRPVGISFTLPAVSTTVAVAVIVGSGTAVADTVTVVFAGRVLGAV